MRSQEVDATIYTYIRAAMSSAEESESARQEMLRHSERRRSAIAVLHRQFGLSVRAIAAHLGCSAAVIQAALQKSSPDTQSGPGTSSD